MTDEEKLEALDLATVADSVLFISSFEEDEEEMNNLMVNAIRQQAAEEERAKVVARLRYGVKEFTSMAKDDPKWELVAEILKEEADVIEEGDYWNG